MKAVFSTPEGTVIRDADEPAPAPDEALVAVRAFSVNRGELRLLAMRTNGWRPGQDVAGVVVEAAADGTGPPPGTRVAALIEGAGWSERAAVPTDRLAALPDEVSMEQAAAIPMAGLTALRTLRLGGDLLGRRVLITGANGGVGHLQVQLAALAGARTTPVRDATTAPGGPYHLIAESVGGASLAASIARVAPGGTIVLFGMSSGEQTPIGLGDFIGHEGARIVTSMSYVQAPPAEDLAVLAGLVAEGGLVPRLGFVEDWSKLPEALTALSERRVPGKLVLTT